MHKHKYACTNKQTQKQPHIDKYTSNTYKHEHKQRKIQRRITTQKKINNKKENRHKKTNTRTNKNKKNKHKYIYIYIYIYI